MEFFSYTGFFLINLISSKRRVFSQPCQGGWAAGDLPPDLGVLGKKVNFKQHLAFMGFLLKPGGRSKSYCQAQANSVQAEQLRTNSVLVLFKAEPSNGQLFHF